MVEMTETANILHNATRESLILIDEIGRGTSTFDGLSLAFAVAEHLATQVGAFTLFATHYFELTQLAKNFDTLSNVHLDATEHNDKIIFLHKLKPGPANQSYGLQVAQLAGVPRAVINAAKLKLTELESQAFQTKTAQHATPRQASFFDASTPAPISPRAVLSSPKPHPALEQLKKIDPDNLSPREALEALYQLKAQTKATSGGKE